MAVSVANQWSKTASALNDVEIVCGPTSGNWLIAVVAWSVNDGTTQTVTVGDVATNLWQLLFSTTTVASVTGTGPANTTLGQQEMQNVQVWACPAAQYTGWAALDVYAAFSTILENDIGTQTILIVELAGMGNGSLTVDSVTLGTATAATSFSITAPAPAADVVMVAAANTDLNSATQTFTAAGWSTLTQISRNKTTTTNYSSPDVRLTSAWRETTATQTATWTSSAACTWAGLVVAFRQTGIAPVQPNSSWPAIQFQVGFGVQAGTPLPAVHYTDQTLRLLQWEPRRGIPYELGSAQSDATDLHIRNDDGAYSARAGGSATANAAGTTTTLVCAAAAVNGVNVSDFFQLKNSSNVLKEYTAFRVTAISTVGATTTITFTNAAEPAGGAPGTGALAATVSGDVYSAIPVDLFIPWRILETWAAKTYVTASGILAEIPQLWLNNHWGETAAVGYDWLLGPSKVEADTILRTQILAWYRATHYWPLDDPQGSPVAQNIGPATTQLTQRASKYGAGSGTAAFGVSTQGLATSVAGQTSTITGDPGTGWQATGMTTAQLNAGQGYALVAQGSDFPSVSSGVTIFGCLYVPSADWTQLSGASNDGTVCVVRSANPAGGSATMIKVALRHAAQAPAVTVWDKTTKAQTVTIGTAAFGQQQWITWALSFNQTHWFLYINGIVNISGTCNLGAGFNTLDIGGEADPYINGFAFGGIHCHVAVIPWMMSDSVQIDLSVGANGGFEFTNQFMASQEIIASGFLGTRIITPSDVQSALSQDASGNLGDQVAALASYEDGIYFADSAGQLQYRSHATQSYQTPVATLGENEAGGELPYQPQWGSKLIGRDPTFLYTATKISNSRQVPGVSGTVTSSLIARAPAKYPKYGVLTLSRNTLLASDYYAWNLAWWLLNIFQSPQNRIEKLVLDAVKNNNLWPFLLGVEVGDIVVVNRRPIGAPAQSVTCRVLHIDVHAEPPETYEVTLTLGPARPQVYVCNDPVLGIVGNGVLGM
jgi:hypothetical protein